MEINKDLEINAPAREVWDVIGRRFTEVGNWCATVRASYPSKGSTPLPGAPSSGRECDTVYGYFRETIQEYNDRNMSIYYLVTGEKLPFFVHGFYNRYTVTSLSEKHSLVSMRAGANMMQPFGWLMSPIMKMQIGKGLSNQVEELKYFIETGEPHPRKIEAMKKEYDT